MSFSKIPSFHESGRRSFHRRAYAHNYKAPFIYHIIIKKADNCEVFGSVIGDARIEYGNPGCAKIEETALGKIIAKSIIHLPYTFPILKLHQFCVMPDHIHILLQKLDWSDEDLDFFMDRLTEDIAKKYSKFKNNLFEVNEIFKLGFCDKPLLLGRSLSGLFKYIRLNPHRLAMRIQYHEFFKRVRQLQIGDCKYEAYGNLFLFRNPDKVAVKISRSFSETEKAIKRDHWLEAASTGTVLISPFISKEEKSIRAEAETLGANIILITHEAFPERYKPSEHNFNLCASGRLLIISLGEPLGSDLTHSICERMNALAAQIVTNC